MFKNSVNFVRRFGARVAVGAVGLASVAANAAGIDVSQVTTTLSDGETAAATIGVGMLVLAAGIGVYKVLRKAG